MAEKKERADLSAEIAELRAEVAALRRLIESLPRYPVVIPAAPNPVYPPPGPWVNPIRYDDGTGTPPPKNPNIWCRTEVGGVTHSTPAA